MTTTQFWTEPRRAHVVRRAASAALSASLLALAACGGGGGGGAGGGSPPPPPPPAANAAPSAVAKVIGLSLQEGQSFTLDASESTDANNDPLTFRWVQTAGPAVVIPDPTLSVIAGIRIPELTRTEQATFKVTVSDGKTSSETSANVSFTDIHQMPRYGAEPPLAVTLPVAGYIQALSNDFLAGTGTFVGISATPTGDVDIMELGHPDTDTFEFLPTPQALNTHKQPMALLRSFNVTYGTDQAFYTVDETANRLRAYSKFGTDNATPMVMRAGLDTDRPCALVEPFFNNPDNLIVGHRRGGCSLIKRTPPDMDNNFTFSEFQRVGTAESFCALAQANAPSVVSGGFNIFPGFLAELLAYDAEANTVSVFREDNATNGNVAGYQLFETKAVQVNAGKPLRFVKAAPVYLDTEASIGLALLFTDDNHIGTHRLVIAGVDPDHKIVQQTISWVVGVPSDATSIYTNQGGSYFANLVVTSSTAPEAMVFKPAKQSDPAEQLIPMSGPEYFEIGLGASLSQVVDVYNTTTNNIDMHLLVSDEEHQEVRIFGPIPN